MYISARGLSSGSLSMSSQSTRQRVESLGIVSSGESLLYFAYFDAVLFRRLYWRAFLFLQGILYPWANKMAPGIPEPWSLQAGFFYRTCRDEIRLFQVWPYFCRTPASRRSQISLRKPALAPRKSRSSKTITRAPPKTRMEEMSSP